jgi:peptidyl-prolyl cis-trans isomerase C
MKHHIPLVVLSTLPLLLLGCGKSNVLGSVNGHDVTQAEFDTYLKVKHIIGADAKRRGAALDEYLERTALAGLIEKEGKLDKAAVDAEVSEFRKEIVISRYFDQFLAEKVSDEAIKNYYDGHVANFEQRKVRVAHILVRTQPKMAETEKAAKRTTAQDIYSKLQAGQSFEELAKSMSDDKISGSKGGDLGWLREGSIDPEFSRRAFAGKAGTFTEPFETPFGFHILKVLEDAKVTRKPYAAAAGDIRYQLRSEAKAAEVKRLKERAGIKRGAISPSEPKTTAGAAPAPQPTQTNLQPQVLPQPVVAEEPVLGTPQPNPVAPSAVPPTATQPGVPPMNVKKTMPTLAPKPAATKTGNRQP